MLSATHPTRIYLETDVGLLKCHPQGVCCPICSGPQSSRLSVNLGASAGGSQRERMTQDSFVLIHLTSAALTAVDFHLDKRLDRPSPRRLRSNFVFSRKNITHHLPTSDLREKRQK